MNSTALEIPGIKLRHGVTSNVGLCRKTNEDSFFTQQPVFLVADGMGGHSAGDVASNLVVECLRPLADQAWVTEEQLISAITVAAQKVDALSNAESAPGSTVSGAVLSLQNELPCWLIFNIGDSRTYRCSANSFTRVTEDHSEIQELLNAGCLSPSEAQTFPRRNVITRALGGRAGPAVSPDLFLLPATTGDRLVMCSDGLSSEVTDVLIETICRTTKDPQETADKLVSSALTAGGKDNVTVIVVDVSEAYPAWDETEADEKTLPGPDNHDSKIEEDTLPRATEKIGSA